ncbi:cob(I)yrinic acid a,c-diamide adenosyltransferase [Thioflexithrix psekupsensis]|uniref:Corrinoid adenosyltransferase n=1 Tax=Thioflexithrix psekupsensis TaxID=1570016 RepID=A0A251XB56_9GAMM|nr:cob(I)yrinic acid a,c-diamide adenosyltransferase [Thioflexithrix psekupsensis]OUD15330.1 ATP:cob(I)alamin adenosyltransferase [Thioflexithrix psekupsensis]
MGYRLSKICTRTGDQGTTGLGDGSRVDKDSPRIEVMGTVDELNSVLGVLLSETLPDALRQTLEQIQQNLFDLGGELSIPHYRLLQAEHVEYLEDALTQLNNALPPLKEFILPNGTRPSTLAHVARTVCRRAERRLVTLMREEPETINQTALLYLNRLSDLLFVMARHLAETETLWHHD